MCVRTSYRYLKFLCIGGSEGIRYHALIASSAFVGHIREPQIAIDGGLIGAQIMTDLRFRASSVVHSQSLLDMLIVVAPFDLQLIGGGQ